MRKLITPFPTTSPNTPSEAPSGVDDLQQRLEQAYPSASGKLIANALEACRLELAGINDPGRLIRCVCERITA